MTKVIFFAKIQRVKTSRKVRFLSKIKTEMSAIAAIALIENLHELRIDGHHLIEKKEKSLIDVLNWQNVCFRPHPKY